MRVVADAADELAHHPEPAAARDRARRRREVAGDDPQQSGLAGAVRPDQRDDGALADPEGDVVQQRPPVGQEEADPVDIDVAHAAP